jgi:signal-transduction protein with cAMP-binding, CBS, and nucleotidyltransferase domain
MSQSAPRSIKIGEIMTESLESINVLNTAKDAAVKMANLNVGSLVVLDDEGKALGIITERDLARRVCTADTNSESITVGQVMTPKVISIRPDNSLEEAANLMVENKLRHLLVTREDNIPLGIITPTDLVAYIKETADLESEKMNNVILQVLREHRRFP